MASSRYAIGLYATSPDSTPIRSDHSVKPIVKKLNMRPATAAHPFCMTSRMVSSGFTATTLRKPALISSACTIWLASKGSAPHDTKTSIPRQNRNGVPACDTTNHQHEAARNASIVLSSAPW